MNVVKIGKAKKILRFFDFFFADIITDRHTEVLLKQPGQIAGRQIGVDRKIFHGDSCTDVGIDIINTLCNRFG